MWVGWGAGILFLNPLFREFESSLVWEFELFWEFRFFWEEFCKVHKTREFGFRGRCSGSGCESVIGC